MYARVTNFKVDPSRLPELSAKVKEMADQAQQQNPGIVEQAGEFYSHHPQLVQALGTGVAIWAMQKLVKR